MKRFFNIPYDDDENDQLYRIIQNYNRLLNELTKKYNLSADSQSVLTQMFLDGASFEMIKMQAYNLKKEDKAKDKDIKKQETIDEDFYIRISEKYHVDIEVAKMICHMLRLGIPMDTIMAEMDKIKVPKERLPIIEMPEQGTIGTGRKTDLEEREI